MVYATKYNRKKTSQMKPVPGREKEQVKNAAGGFVFAADDATILDRFLIIGTEDGSYYESAEDLTRQNAEAIIKMLDGDGIAKGISVVDRIVEISDSGRALKNSPALFALALAITSKREAVRKAAAAALPKVARTGAHLFEFCEYIEALGGWGRLKKTAVARWYLDMPLDKLAYQLVKYRQRNGWTHRDVLRLTHPKVWRDGGAPDDLRRQVDLFTWATHGIEGLSPFPKTANFSPLIGAYEVAKSFNEGNVSGVVSLIKEFNLPREALPTWAMQHDEVWEALLEKMPMTALVRNLGNLGKHNILVNGAWDNINAVVSQLTSANVRASRLHPMTILMALKTYEQGQGMRGHGEWPVVPQVVEALNTAFYQSFDNVVPSGKRIVIGIDESGSMGTDYSLNRNMLLAPCEMAAVMAMTTVKVERNVYVMGFNDRAFDLPLLPSHNLAEVMKIANLNNGGATNASIIIQAAQQNKIKADAFILYSDGETWAGDTHVFQALKAYRKEMGIPAKLLCVNFTANKTTMIDPTDPDSADFVGVDAGLSQAVSEYLRIGE